MKKLKEIRKIGCQYGLEVEDLKEEDMPMV